MYSNLSIYNFSGLLVLVSMWTPRGVLLELSVVLTPQKKALQSLAVSVTVLEELPVGYRSPFLFDLPL